MRKIAGAVGIALAAVCAGALLHLRRPDAVQVPAGEAGLPSADDINAALPSVKIPERLPEFTLNDRNGHATSLARWQGKSLILNFWATWCAPCRHEIPLLKSLSDEWGGRDVQVVGIAVDHRDKVLAYADELKILYPLLIGEEDALDVVSQLGFDSPVFPFTVFADRRGDVVTIFVGELHKPQADFILSVLQRVNDNALDLVEARRDIADGLHGLAAGTHG